MNESASLTRSTVNIPTLVVLASGSPRRTELLSWANVKHSILIPDVDETPLKKETPQKMVERLSLMKARAVAERLIAAGPTASAVKIAEQFVIAADTTVVSATNKNLGKPETPEEAVKMMQALQGKRHFVFTGYTVLKIAGSKIKKELVKSVRTDVHMKKLSKGEILDYIAKGESMDKAGAYAAQGFGMVLIDRIVGSYTNVVGLPVAQVVQDLKKLGYKK
jgi:septum formation protein